MSNAVLDALAPMTQVANLAPVAPAAPAPAPVIPRMSVYRALGEDVRHLTKIPDILATVGADFEAYGVEGTYTDREGNDHPDGRLSVVRSDSHESVGNHSLGYVIVQYANALDIALEAVGLAGSGTVLDTVGTMQDGGQFYAAIDLGTLTLDPNGVADKIKRFLILFASHNGTFPIMFVPQMQRIECMNQLPAVRAGARGHGGFLAKHTKNVPDKLAIAKGALGIAQAAQDAFIAQAEKMLHESATEITVERLVRKLWSEPKPDATQKAKTQFDNVMAKTKAIYNSDTCVGSVGHNKWAVYQAVGEYLDHGRGTDRDKRAIASITPGAWVEKKKEAALAFLSN